MTFPAVCLKALGVMPRKMRVQFPGSVYHVMSRGDQRARNNGAMNENRKNIGSDPVPDKWLGNAALACCALMLLQWRLGVGSETGRVIIALSLFVLGTYCAVRGMFMGRWPSRLCAGVAVLYWAWVLYSLAAALRVVRT